MIHSFSHTIATFLCVQHSCPQAHMPVSFMKFSLYRKNNFYIVKQFCKNTCLGLWICVFLFVLFCFETESLCAVLTLLLLETINHVGLVLTEVCLLLPL